MGCSERINCGFNFMENVKKFNMEFAHRHTASCRVGGGAAHEL